MSLNWPKTTNSSTPTGRPNVSTFPKSKFRRISLARIHPHFIRSARFVHSVRSIPTRNGSVSTLIRNGTKIIIPPPSMIWTVSSKDISRGLKTGGRLHPKSESRCIDTAKRYALLPPDLMNRVLCMIKSKLITRSPVPNTQNFI
jgi:hypothetical protein